LAKDISAFYSVQLILTLPAASYDLTALYKSIIVIIIIIIISCCWVTK